MSKNTDLEFIEELNNSDPRFLQIDEETQLPKISNTHKKSFRQWFFEFLLLIIISAFMKFNIGYFSSFKIETSGIPFAIIIFEGIFLLCFIYIFQITSLANLINKFVTKNTDDMLKKT